MSEWHNSVSSASDSRFGEQVLNIKTTQHRTWANGPYWYGTSQAGTHIHTHTHANIQTLHKGRIPPQWQSKAERTCMFNSQPSISACSCSYSRHTTPNPHALSHTHRDVRVQRRWTWLAKNEWAHMGVKESQQHLFYFPKRSLCNGSTTFQTNPAPLLGLDVPLPPHEFHVP